MSESPKRISIGRRSLLIAGAAILATAGTAGLLMARRDQFHGDELSPPDALEAIRAGEVVMIDIRRPDEWAETGIAEGAHPIDMRRDDFVEALVEVTGGQRDVAVALICARGVRSDRMSARLAEAGFTHIIDVPEGMLGSRAGPGWLARDLPVMRP